MFSKFKQINITAQNQIVGLLILLFFCLLSFGIGYFSGKDACISENPATYKLSEAMAAEHEAQMNQIIETAVQASDRSCRKLIGIWTESQK